MNWTISKQKIIIRIWSFVCEAALQFEFKGTSPSCYYNSNSKFCFQIFVWIWSFIRIHRSQKRSFKLKQEVKDKTSKPNSNKKLAIGNRKLILKVDNKSMETNSKKFFKVDLESIQSVLLCVVRIYLYSDWIFSVNLRIQSEYRKIRIRKNSVFAHFSRSVDVKWVSIFLPLEMNFTTNSRVFINNFTRNRIYHNALTQFK